MLHAHLPQAPFQHVHFVWATQWRRPRLPLPLPPYPAVNHAGDDRQHSIHHRHHRHGAPGALQRGVAVAGRFRREQAIAHWHDCLERLGRASRGAKLSPRRGACARRRSSFHHIYRPWRRAWNGYPDTAAVGLNRRFGRAADALRGQPTIENLGVVEIRGFTTVRLRRSYGFMDLVK